MAYIGNSPANTGNYQIVDDISSSFNGSLTSFALTAGGIAITPAKSGQILANINGVMQEPDDGGTNGFKVTSSNIVFSSAPASGDTFWAVYQGQNVDIGTPSDDVVDTAHIKDGAITGAKIAAGTVVASDIADGSITAVKVAADVATQAELDTVSTVASAALPKAGGAMTGNVIFNDNVKAVFGTSSDGLEIYHDASDSIIADTGTGDLKIKASNDLVLSTHDGEAYIACVQNGAVKLYYDRSTYSPSKLETTATGIDVTGITVTDGLTTSANVLIADDQKILFGAGNDLKIYHDTTADHSYIYEAGGGDLIIKGANVEIQGTDGGKLAQFSNQTWAGLFYNNSEKIRTTNTGIDVTGSVTASGSAGGTLSLRTTDTGGATGEDLGRIEFYSGDTSTGSLGNMATIISEYDSNGDSASIKLQTGFSTGSGSPTLRDRVLFGSNGDISFYEDTGSTPKFFWDASAEKLGIGVTAPNNKLTLSDGSTSYTGHGGGTYLEVVRGSGADAGIILNKDTGQWMMGIDNSDGTNPPLRFEYSAGGSAHAGLGNGTVGLTLNYQGKVGIGDAAPAAKLQVQNTSAGPFLTAANATAIFTGSSDVGKGGAIGFDYGSGHTNYPVGMGYAVTSQTGNTKGDLVFGTRSATSDSAPTERLRITSDGRGIAPFTAKAWANVDMGGSTGHTPAIRNSHNVSSVTDHGVGNVEIHFTNNIAQYGTAVWAVDLTQQLGDVFDVTNYYGSPSTSSARCRVFDFANNLSDSDNVHLNVFGDD